MSTYDLSEETFSTHQTIEILGVSSRTLYRWINEDKIRYLRTSTGRYRIPKSEVDRIKKTQKQSVLKRMREVIIDTVKNKGVAYLREMQITLEDYLLHEDTDEVLSVLSESGEINTITYEGNRWFFSKDTSWESIRELAEHKKKLMDIYISHPRNYTRRGVIYDDYSEMLVEDALIKTGYVVVSKNTHYFNGKEYHQASELRRPGRRRDLDYIAYLKDKDLYFGMQIKNRLEYPKLEDVHLLIDICTTLDLVPLLVTRLSHPRIYALFGTIQGEVIQMKRYLLQPPFPKEAFSEITTVLRIPLGVYQWVPDFLLSRFRELREKL